MPEQNTTDLQKTTEAIARLQIASELVSVNAVFVPDGDDPAPHLLEAGIVDPVAVPFSLGESDAATAFFGDSLPAVFEPRTSGQPLLQQDAGSTRQASDPVRNTVRPEPPLRTTTLPAAFGMKPLAPVAQPR
jgi:hypothetical protein